MKYFKFIVLFTMALFIILWTLFLKPQPKTTHVTQAPIWIRGEIQKNFSSNLPLIIIDGNNSRIRHSVARVVKMSIIEPNETNQSRLEMPTSYHGHVRIQVRGSSSLQFPKKQYKFTTQTVDGKEDDVSLLGMPKEHKWILHAPYSDKTLMRNYLAYTKTREINAKKYYAVRSRFVEVLQLMDGKYNYEGVYLLMEKIKRDKHRINIKKSSSQKISGGYIVKLDKDVPDNAYLKHKENKKFLYEYPNILKLNASQKLYISEYLKDFQQALYSDDFNLSSSKNYYAKWIDIDSFIVHFLSREFFLDADTWMFSEYIHKDTHQKLFLSAVWDFNSGMGNDNYNYQGNFEFFAYKKFVDGAPYTISAWIQRLMSDPIFYTKVKAKWTQLRQGIWSDKEMIGFIDSTAQRLALPAKRNFQKWKRVLGRFVWPNRKSCRENGKRIYCKTFEEAVEHDLKAWILLRANWIDKNL